MCKKMADIIEEFRNSLKKQEGLDERQIGILTEMYRDALFRHVSQLLFPDVSKKLSWVIMGGVK